MPQIHGALIKTVLDIGERKMQIAIISVTTGNGHNSTADAIAEEFHRQGIKAVKEDLFEYCSSFLFSALDRGYQFSTRYMPRQFGSTYNGLESHGALRKLLSPMSGNGYVVRKFSEYFRGNTPDAIIATHVFAAQVLNELKSRGVLDMPLIGIITDYCIHPFWEECTGLDYIVTASGHLRLCAKKKGMDISRILPFGIPIKPGFLSQVPKETARQMLGLNPGQRTILMMGGSMGYGKLFSHVQELLEMEENQQIVCICGNNQKLYQNLKEFANPNLHVRGFVDNVETYMDAADCIVTKPGGLTLAELMAKKLPAILINPIPGPEERNLDFMLNCGGAVKASDYFPVSDAVYFLFSNPGRLRLMRETLGQIAHPDAARRICDFTIKTVKDAVEAG
jgi:processive 1,2-diacylglycerol beta-glucosyltransferase